jgi:hypothetical protein
MDSERGEMLAGELKAVEITRKPKKATRRLQIGMKDLPVHLEIWSERASPSDPLQFVTSALRECRVLSPRNDGMKCSPRLLP